jgi:hypothetical protein
LAVMTICLAVAACLVIDSGHRGSKTRPDAFASHRNPNGLDGGATVHKPPDCLFLPNEKHLFGACLFSRRRRHCGPS